MLTETTPPDAEEVAVDARVEGYAVGPLRAVLLAFGFVFVGLAALGVFLPLLPTTPFLLLAAACFAKSSQRFYAALLGNRVFGPLIRDWRAHRSIPRHAKWMAITAIVLVMGSTALFVLVNPIGQIALLAFGAGLCTWLWRQPSREDAAADREIS